MVRLSFHFPEALFPHNRLLKHLLSSITTYILYLPNTLSVSMSSFSQTLFILSWPLAQVNTTCLLCTFWFVSPVLNVPFIQFLDCVVYVTTM